MIASLFYTTASEAMVRPKIKFGDWHHGELQGLVRSNYLNNTFVGTSCMTPIDELLDPTSSAESCLNIEYSGQCKPSPTPVSKVLFHFITILGEMVTNRGQAYRNLLGFMYVSNQSMR